MSEPGAFAGARVVVTGAGGIFGRRIAGAFARAGARLGLSDHRPITGATLAVDGGNSIGTAHPTAGPPAGGLPGPPG
jgi:NADP-dependent 3-hydroxy acid dehydrogenase YdfG